MRICGWLTDPRLLQGMLGHLDFSELPEGLVREARLSAGAKPPQLLAELRDGPPDFHNPETFSAFRVSMFLECKNREIKEKAIDNPLFHSDVFR